MTSQTIGFKTISKTESGFRALEQLPSDLAAVNASYPLLITDRYNSEKHIKTVTDAFRCTGYSIGVYDGITPDSDINTVSEISKIYKKNGFDSIISLGNSNIVHISKIVNIAVSDEKPDLPGRVGIDKIKYNLNPFVLVPVLNQDGHEASSTAILGDSFYTSKHLMPDIVCIDERIISEDSPKNVVNRAFKALSIASESYTDDDNHLSASYSHLTTQFVMENLKDVVENSLKEKNRLGNRKKEKLIQRLSLVNASVMSGYISSNREKGLSEILGQTAAKNVDIPEGILMGIILPYSLEYKSYRKNADLENFLLPVSGIENYCTTPKDQRFESAIGKIRILINELYSLTSTQIPRTLADAGLKESDLSEIAKEAANDNFHEATCFFILEHAFSGKPVTP